MLQILEIEDLASPDAINTSWNILDATHDKMGHEKTDEAYTAWEMHIDDLVSLSMSGLCTFRSASWKWKRKLQKPEWRRSNLRQRCAAAQVYPTRRRLKL